jgi:primosomal protein N'
MVSSAIVTDFKQRSVLHHAIKQQLAVIGKIRKGGQLRWSIDIDPLDT